MVIYKQNIALRGEVSPDAIAALTKKIGHGRMFVTGLTPDGLSICQVTEAAEDPDKALRAVLEKAGIPCGRIRREPIGVRQLAMELENGSGQNLCPEVPEVLIPLCMMAYVAEPFSDAIREATFERLSGVQEAMRLGRRRHSESLMQELERIWNGKQTAFCGHPVLYSISSETEEQSTRLADLLLSSLYSVGRLPANRACFLSPCQMPLPDFVLEEVYNAQSGAAILVDLVKPDGEGEAETAVRTILRLAQEHRRDVLTVFRTYGDGQTGVENMRRLVEGLPVLELTHDRIEWAEARRMLRAMARQENLPPKEAAACIGEIRRDFAEEEVRRAFADFRDGYLQNVVFPQYAGVLEPMKTENVRKSAMDELQELVGLQEAKRVLAQAEAYAKLQSLCRSRGLPTQPLQMHMVFSGNPGTAKTTAARLTARILRECGALPVGDLVEVGRGDLIGKYAGWTARLVKEKFREARGSVLFIDEAYSLLDDRENQFGDEAINTIVQEMENHREDTVVIFAGYREPMERFLERNPGLRSRVSFFVDFPDYTPDELVQIVRLQAGQQNRTLTPEAEVRVRELVKQNVGTEGFGNGRFARTLVETAVMQQALRLSRMDPEAITDTELCCLQKEDFSAPVRDRKEHTARRIGFGA